MKRKRNTKYIISTKKADNQKQWVKENSEKFITKEIVDYIQKQIPRFSFIGAYYFIATPALCSYYDLKRVIGLPASTYTYRDCVTREIKRYLLAHQKQS